MKRFVGEISLDFKTSLSGSFPGLKGKRELVALLNLSSWCLVVVERLFLAVPWGCLRFVIVVFPDHTMYSPTIFNTSEPRLGPTNNVRFDIIKRIYLSDAATVHCQRS